MVRHRRLLGCLALALAACTPKPSPSPSPSASGAPTSPSAASPAPATPSTQPVRPAASAAATEERESADTWLVVRESGIELGVIELRKGKPPKLSVEKASEAASKLSARLEAIGGPEGIALKMHLPPPSGEGRGPLGSRIVKYDDTLYRHALKEELEPQYSVKEVMALLDPLPPASVKVLKVTRSGEKVGSVDFGTTPPKVTRLTEKSDGSSLESDLERVKELGQLSFRYHHQPTGGTDTLVTAQAKPGDAHYARTVVLYLMVERFYRKRYAYQLSFD